MCRSLFRFGSIDNPLQCFVYMSVSCQYARLVGREEIAIKVGNFSSGFLHHQKTSSTVPRLKMVLIEPIETPGSHPAKVNGSAAQPPYGYASLDKS